MTYRHRTETYRRPVERLARLLLLLAAVSCALAAGAWLSVRACVGQPGRGPFNIQGVVLDEAGRPVSGLSLMWLPRLPGRGEPDLENLYFSVAGRPENRALTDDQGRFELSGVQDYFGVESQQYLVWGSDVLANPPRNIYWRVTDGEVSLARTPPTTLTVQLTARPAGAMRVNLRRQDGTPFDGVLPVAFGAADGESACLALTCAFVNGQYLQGGLEPGRMPVAILTGHSVEEIKFKSYVAAYATQGPSPVVQFRPKDVAVQSEATVVAGEVREVTLTLPPGYPAAK